MESPPNITDKDDIVQVLIGFRRSLLDELDRVSGQWQQSRSQLVREAVRIWLQKLHHPSSQP